MKNIDRGLNMLAEDDKDRCIKEIISYFHTERNETIGVIAAGNMLDFFLENIAPDVYNKGIEDAKKMLKNQLEGWDVEFDLLKRQKG